MFVQSKRFIFYVKFKNGVQSRQASNVCLEINVVHLPCKFIRANWGVECSEDPNYRGVQSERFHCT